jgi:hypothetical protein
MELDTLIKCSTAKGEQQKPQRSGLKMLAMYFPILCVEINVKISELKDDLINGFNSANE